MPTKPAAAKAWRQNRKARARNTAVKNSIKKLTVQVRKALAAKQLDQAKTLGAQLVKALDKAAQKKVISRNTAARKKSRFHRTLRQVSS